MLLVINCNVIIFVKSLNHLIGNDEYFSSLISASMKIRMAIALDIEEGEQFVEGVLFCLYIINMTVDSYYCIGTCTLLDIKVHAMRCMFCTEMRCNCRTCIYII